MDLSSLEILIAAIEEKSLSRGAERVHLVTSAVSKRISELERRLGTTLLRRHGRGVEATPAGAMLYQQAKAILRNVAQARELLGAFSDSGAPKLRLRYEALRQERNRLRVELRAARRAAGEAHGAAGQQLRVLQEALYL